MKFGLEGRHWQTIEDLLIRPLKSKGAKVWIFGSRARGDHRPFSDLDVLYSSPNEIRGAELAEIVEALEESTLPIKVDIVALSSLAESYRESVLKDRVGV